MRIEKHTREMLDMAFEDMTIKYFQEPENGEQFGAYRIQELVFFNTFMLLHVSDALDEETVFIPCRKISYSDIDSYEFDLDNNLLTMKVYNRPVPVKIYANPIQLEKIYKIITTLDEKFILTEFDDINKLFDDYING